MRVKFDGTLFNQEDMDSLMKNLKEKGIDMQLVKKSSAFRKGILDDPVTVSWIATISSAFLPVVVDVVYSYLKNNKEKGKIDIELRHTDGQEKKITISTDQPYSELEIQAEKNGDIRIFITRK